MSSDLADAAAARAEAGGHLELVLGKLAHALDRMDTDAHAADMELTRAVQPVNLPAVQFTVTGGTVQASVLAQQLLGPEDGQVWRLGRLTVAGLAAPAAAGSSTGNVGSITSPAAGNFVVTKTPGAGTYTVGWTVQLTGTVSATDTNNFQLQTSGAIATSLNSGAVGTYLQPSVTVTVPAATAITIAAIATATVGATYTGQLIITPVAGSGGDQVTLYRETAGIGGLAQNKLRTFTAVPPLDVWEPSRVYLRSPETLALVGTGLAATAVTLSGEAEAIDIRYLARYLI